MISGTLALVGSGEYLPPMEPVDRLLLSRIEGQPHVVCLPTAAGTEGKGVIAYWSDLGVKHFTRLGVSVEAVPIIDRASAQDESLAERIRAANFVYLSGGKPPYLYQTLNGTPAWDAIMYVLDAGGVVAGCSAGAMIMGERATPLPWYQGFGLLDGAIILPHYNEFSPRTASVVRALLGTPYTLLGIEGDTALVHHQDTNVVSGAGGVTVWNRQKKTRFTDGQTLLWP